MRRLTALANWRSFVFLLLASAATGGCTKVQYTHGWSSLRLKQAPESLGNFTTAEGATEVARTHNFDLETNEILLLDQTGVVCAALMTEAERTGNAYEAAYKAAREAPLGATVEVNYSYRLHNPAEYRGIECGAYYRGGSGTGTGQTLVSDGGTRTVTIGETEVRASSWETGLSFGGVEGVSPEVPWLRYSAHMRFGFGKHDVRDTLRNEANTVPGDLYFTLPLHFGLMAFPEFAYGFGIGLEAGADLISWLGPGGIIEKADYGIRAEWGYGIKEAAVGVFAAWLVRNTYVYSGTEDYWSRASGVHIGGYLQVHFESL